VAESSAKERTKKAPMPILKQIGETGALFLISLFLMVIFPNGQSS
jgi:hypothetical protein